MELEPLNETLSLLRKLTGAEAKEMYQDIRDIRKALMNLVKHLEKEAELDDDFLERQKKLWRLKNQKNTDRRQALRDLVPQARGKEYFR